MLKGFKYRLYPSDDQSVLLDKHFGCTRFIYNLALETRINAYQGNKVSISRYDLQKQVVDLKDDYIWLKEVNSQSLQSALLNLDYAYKRFFQTKKGFPKFKKKSSKNTFSVPQSVVINDDKLWIPKFESGIKMIVDRKHKGVIKSATISRTVTGKHYVSILCETGEMIPEKKEIRQETTIGIDLGIKDFLVFSDGRKVNNPNFLKSKLEFLKFLQRKLSKQNKKSNRYNKTKQRLALEHEYITNQRQDFLHKLSTEITNQYDTICIEDLNVSGMIQNHKLAQSISDVSWSEFTRMIGYKSLWKGKNVITIPRFYPSSKTCHVCGFINKGLTLKDREWVCPDCQSHHDRDENAAINIKYWPWESRLLNVEAGSVDERLSQDKPKKHLVCESLKVLESTFAA
jgi:putative transposase